MKKAALLLDIITPEGAIFNGQISGLVVPAYEGKLGILKNHLPLVAKLKAGELKATITENQIKKFTIKGGFLEVKNNKITVLASV